MLVDNEAFKWIFGKFIKAPNIRVMEQNVISGYHFLYKYTVEWKPQYWDWTKTMLENCFQSEGVFSCLSNGGMFKSWEQCRKHCESKYLEPFYLAKLIILIRSGDFMGNKLKFLPCFANFQIFQKFRIFKNLEFSKI